MTQSRQLQISLSDTSYYHCISRCVCRAYLCGEDKYTEKSFEHRRQWVVERMHYLASLFNIDILEALAVYAGNTCKLSSLNVMKVHSRIKKHSAMKTHKTPRLSSRLIQSRKPHSKPNVRLLIIN